MGYQKIIIQGRITKEPIYKKTNTARDYASIIVAVNETFKGKKFCTYFYCQGWDKTAQFIGSFMEKGDLVLVELSYYNYTNVKNDVKEYKSAFTIHRIMVAGKRDTIELDENSTDELDYEDNGGSEQTSVNNEPF